VCLVAAVVVLLAVLFSGGHAEKAQVPPV